ncbi:odorant receptor 74a isoform X2 [Bactrocera oleae]|uniref:odorant receptor 74a isoform X2 n=1 Tax=Bactrocera oleae TaxID=104688 RepID=UPI0006B6C71B|nr:odorant receptor 35a-like isoform X2 [Bactrocera oleae]
MDYFVPLQFDNRPIILPIQVAGYKFNFLWPLKEDASILSRLVNNICLGVSVLCYIGTILGEFTFIGENIGDIPAVAECLCTSFMGVQYIIRIFVLLSRQRALRKLLRNFYRDIYFTHADDAALCKEINSIIRFMNIFTQFYYTPMVLILALYVYDVASVGLASPDKPFIYRMSFRWYDAQVPLQFIITAIYSGWLTISCVTIWTAEDYTLCLVLCHASFRYKKLRLDLQQLLEMARADLKGGETPCTNQNLHTAFRRRLCEIFRRQQRLNGFVVEAKAHFTHQIFYIMSFGVLLLCVVSFQFQSGPITVASSKYISWLISQTAQFLLIGYFGQMLMDETTELRNSFYCCRWEDLLVLGDPRSNKLLLGDVQFAIMNSQEPIVFDGMKFFPLTYSTVSAALRSAVSYFMFLNTMNGEN